jgi:LuxR family maltose regulon positive regulatory protein
MTGFDLPLSAAELLAAGTRTLAAGDWERSRAYFQAAVAAEETPEALEGLATAAWWLDDAPVIFGSRELAYRLYRERGDRLGAARLATWLGLDHYLYRGEPAVANGWLRRAHRWLVGIEPSFEHGWLALVEAHIALFEHHDVATAKEVSAATVDLARSLALIDLEMLALALHGLALVSEGRISDGMRRLDESTTAALSGEMTDPDAIVTACCYLIYACERVHDFDRAAQWCNKVTELCRRWSYRSMLAICRVHYGAVLMWQGEWPQAEAELAAACRDLAATRPGWAGEGALRLAELRRRQGRWDEAATLFAQASAYPLALLGQAELALGQGDVVLAADLVDRFLRRLPPEDRTERARGLELAVRVRLALGEIDHARGHQSELEATADLVGTDPLRGSARFARGLIAAAASDFEAARRSLEDAVDLFHHCGAPFEAARSRLELAPVLATVGRPAAAAAAAREALETVRRLGARQETDRAARLLRELAATASDAGATPPAPADLTRREAEVLCLVAQGQSNQQIAQRLFISVRTVERHVSTVYAKIGAEGTAARAIATAYAIERGLLQSSPA